jgi:hypothetical protein
MVFENQAPGKQVSTGIGTKPVFINGAIWNSNAFVKKNAILAPIGPANKFGIRGKNSKSSNKTFFSG